MKTCKTACAALAEDLRQLWDAVLLKRALLASALCFLAAHAYTFLNANLSHDSLVVYSGPNAVPHVARGLTEEAWQIGLGRFLQVPLWSLRGHLNAPWLLGMLAGLFLALEVYLIVRLLGVTQKKWIFLLAGLLTTNLTLTASFATFFNWADVYALAALLASCAVYMVRRFSSPLRFVLAAGCVAAVFALYSAYINVALVLILLLVLQDALQKQDWPTLLRHIAAQTATLVAGVAAYFVSLRLVLGVTGFALQDSYNGLVQAFELTPLSVLQKLPKVCALTLSLLFQPQTYVFSASTVCNCLLMLATGVLLLVRLQKLHSPLHALLTLAAVVTLPLAANFVGLFFAHTYHILMKYASFLFYAFCIVVFQRGGGRRPTFGPKARAAREGASCNGRLPR